VPASRPPVGVFDSGVGGLTVVREIRRMMPDLDIIYFGDTARLPYGNKSPETIIRYSQEIANFLTGQGIGFLVVACNTSSSLALDVLSSALEIPVMGMIEPGARMAVRSSREGRIGLIGTRATVASKAYEREIRRMSPSAFVASAACPLFVPLVEEGWAMDPIALHVARRYLEPLFNQRVDTLILGCTHYPVLIPTLREIAGDAMALVSSAEAAATELRERLYEGNAPSREEGSLKVFVTDSGTHFKAIGELVLGTPISNLERVEEERLVLHEK
jgi:glutamate racemase